MTLEIVNGTAGLWREPGWTLGQPGVYALVVGVSVYPCLEGGATPAAQTYGLGQLLSSASTAAAVFEWLRTDYRRDQLPVVWCYLLLAPTAEERAQLDAAGLTHYAHPDYETLRRAIKAWVGAVPGQPPAAQRSRTLFFFSGHGMQVHRRALLLPSDYLDSSLGAPDVQNCISAEDLQEWMKESPVAEHLALLDACRNEVGPLAELGATAYPLFPRHPPTGVPPVGAATLSSASPNTVAYQMPGHPYTFFGQAVLEALGGAAAGAGPTLEFRELVDHVRPRVNLLLQQASGQPLPQTVRQSFDGEDFVLTEIPAGGGRLHTLSTASPAGFGMAQIEPTIAVREALRARFDEALAVDDPIRLSDLAGSFQEAHRRFGHEYASWPWVDGRAALHALGDGRACSDAAVVLAVRRNDSSSLVQVDLALEPREGGVLLVFSDERHVARGRLAVALPTDSMGRVPVRLELVLEPQAAGGMPVLQKLEARLGPSDWNPHYQYLAGLQREADLGSLKKAAQRADPDRLRDAAQDKQAAETAATAGMLLLARSGRIGDVQDWTRNLMRWFPAIPDAAVLWAESLRAALARGETQPFGVTDPTAEMLAALEALVTRGVPYFADSLDLAEDVLRHLRRRPSPEVTPARIEAVAQWLRRALAATLPAGHFLVVQGLPRPASLANGSGPLTVAEILQVLRGTST
jgi:hypothetical protein